jgi:hypothetical protein
MRVNKRVFFMISIIAAVFEAVFLDTTSGRPVRRWNIPVNAALCRMERKNPSRINVIVNCFWRPA